MFLKNIIKRTKLEWKYYTKRPWSIKEVGEFWNSVEEYDKINDKLYTYMERFSVSKQLFFEFGEECFNQVAPRYSKNNCIRSKSSC